MVYVLDVIDGEPLDLQESRAQNKFSSRHPHEGNAIRSLYEAPHGVNWHR